MARPRKIQEDRKTIRLTVRLTELEAERIDARANQAGFTVSEFLRAASLNVEAARSRGRAPVKDAQALGQLLGQVGRIGNNINQLAHMANMGMWAEAEALEDALADIHWMRKELMKALGVREQSPAPGPALDE